MEVLDHPERLEDKIDELTDANRGIRRTMVAA
jgi:hypothetical protein